MLGCKSGLVQRLDTYTRKKLYKMHCLAHRLHLAIRHVFENDQIKNINIDFEKILNDINFIMQVPKNLQRLRIQLVPWKKSFIN